MEGPFDEHVNHLRSPRVSQNLSTRVTAVTLSLRGQPFLGRDFCEIRVTCCKLLGN